MAKRKREIEEFEEEEKIATREEMKEEAIKLMKKLDIYKPYINGFKNKDWVCFFENFGGYWAYQEEKIQNKIKELEERYGFVVYAVTHEKTNIGEMYDFLFVSKYKSDWDNQVYCSEVSNDINEFIALAYVWNVDYEYDSEIGSILLQSYGGGIRRIG